MAGKIWFLISLCLIGLELLTPGFFMLWLGVAAGITGLGVLFFGVDIFAWQAALFALVSRDRFNWRGLQALVPPPSLS